MTTVSVRYIVDDIDAAIAFYTTALQFEGADAPQRVVRDAQAR